jgi:putative ABC transport system ATP-binding protein
MSKMATENHERFVKESILEVQNITKEVNSPEGVLTILKDISLTINSGDVTSVVGPSGSGKTTLLAIMAGLDLPTTGTINLLGEEITRMNEDRRAQVRSKNVGFVFQSFHLLPRLTALDNIMLPLEILGDNQAKEKSMSALSQMGLEKRALHLPNQLSGGEKQRVAIARAMVKEPTVLFADEPTGNLDKNSTGKISDLLLDINRSFGTTIVIVTHDLSLAEKGNNMHELNEGELV